MTEIIFDVVDLVGEVHPGDQVSVWPPYVTATVDGRVRSTRKIDVLVDEGPVTLEVEPGPLVVHLQCRGIADTKPRTVTIPDEGTITLANLIQSTFTYTPAVVSQVTLNAQRAEDAAVRAEGVADVFGSLEGVADQVQAASGYAQAALEEADRSSSEADRAEAAAQSASAGVQPDTVGRLHLTPDLRGEIDGKAPSVHNHDGAYYTKAQADGRYVGTSGNTTISGSLDLDGGSVGYIRPDTTGGWARGFWWKDRDYTSIAGIGAFGNGSAVDYIYLGHGDEPWGAPVFRAYQDFIRITNLDVTGAVTGIEADDVGAAPATHTHSQYATTSALESHTPEIRVVSTIPTSPTPGVVYLKFG